MSLIRNDYPWIYDSGTELIKALNSEISEKEKAREVDLFIELLEFSTKHPIMEEIYGINEDLYLLCREMRRFFIDYLKKEVKLDL